VREGRACSCFIPSNDSIFDSVREGRAGS